jgi:hypothetical protein
VGKGIGYLLFKDRDSVLKALTLHKVRSDVPIRFVASTLTSNATRTTECVQEALAAARIGLRQAHQALGTREEQH